MIHQDSMRAPITQAIHECRMSLRTLAREMATERREHGEDDAVTLTPAERRKRRERLRVARLRG